MLTNPRTLPSSPMSHVVLLAHQPRSPSCVTQLLSRRPEDAPAPPADQGARCACVTHARQQGSLKQATHTLHEATRRSRQLLQPLGPVSPSHCWSFSISRAFSKQLHAMGCFLHNLHTYHPLRWSPMCFFPAVCSQEKLTSTQNANRSVIALNAPKPDSHGRNVSAFPTFQRKNHPK